MLNLMDVPIVVQRQDRSWLDYGGMEMKNNVRSSISNQNIMKVNGIGPQWLGECNRQNCIGVELTER